MIRLRQYTQSDEEQILSWCDSEDTFFKWTFGLLGEYPITKEKFRKTSEYTQFTAVDEDEPVGYFIARNPNGTKPIGSLPKAIRGPCPRSCYKSK